MKRREFIRNGAAIAAAIGSADILKAADLVSSERTVAGSTDRAAGSPDRNATETASSERTSATAAEGKLIVSAPMLQNFSTDSIGVVFAVSALASGYVLIGERADLGDAVKVKCGGYRFTDLDDRVMRVRLTGLKPDTLYHYRIGADRIAYNGGYDMHVIGNEEDPKTYSFRTAGSEGASSFCVINDTHARWEPFSRAVEKVAQLSPACVIWNGDATNNEATVDNLVSIFLNPDIKRKDYASETPYLFCPGNHDFRGMANRHLERVWMFRQNEERSSRDWDLGRNFAVRQGDIALIGLDTAEDKLDTNPLFAGLFNSGSYREAQTAWLKDALSRPEIRKAPFLVTFCHIPLFDPDPAANPGDLAPDDKAPGYKTDYAAWQRTCSRLWTPLLEKAGCQLIITGHQHRFRYDAPDSERPWAQIVGGGPNLQGDENRFPTVIDGSVEKGELKIKVWNLRTGGVCGEYSFRPRKRHRK